MLLGAIPFSGPAVGAEWGTLRGRFVYDGEPPELKPLVVTKDQAYCGKHPLIDESLVVGKNRGVANVVVYVRTPDVKVHPELAEAVKPKVVLDNLRCRFEPHILPVWLEKQTLVVKNSDPVLHNVNLQPFDDKGINPVLPVKGAVDHRFTKAQIIPVPVACNLHPWMKGYVLPRNNPYVAVSGKDGVFTLEKLPAGPLEFQVWHEAAGYVRLPDWKRGRFTLTIQKDVHELGEIKLPAELFRQR